MKEEIRHLSYKKFMEEFRPNGYGVCGVSSFDGTVDQQWQVTEVICDFCNALIPEGDDIWLIGSHAICFNCQERHA